MGGSVSWNMVWWNQKTHVGLGLLISIPIYTHIYTYIYIYIYIYRERERERERICFGVRKHCVLEKRK